MGSGLLVLSVGDGVRQGGGAHSCRLSSGGRISSTLRTTGEEVFFRLATASLRVTPVRSSPFTFNKMSPAGEVGGVGWRVVVVVGGGADSTAYSLGLMNAFRQTSHDRDS